jgi:YfiH family protein
MPIVILRTDRWGAGIDAHHGTTERDDGDFALDRDADDLGATRRAAVDLPWVWLRQVHGAQVHRVEAGREHEVRGREGDALVSPDAGVVLAVQTADCVPVTFSSPEGVIGIAHAGWRGIEAGVLQATVAAMVETGASTLRAAIGPCIHAECYEFGDADLDRLIGSLGPRVERRTADGARSLDTVAAVCVVLGRAGVEVAGISSSCTGCEPAAFYSHRARGESGRMATVVWRDPLPAAGQP